MVFASLMAVIFWFRRDFYIAKALAVPPFVGMIVEYYKASHDGISPVAVLGVALLLHAMGDIVINRIGVIESMPFFLLGHLAYCRSFARGCDVSLRRFRQFEKLKKLTIVASIVYAVGMFKLLEPSFEGPLKVVLILYIFAICLMFNISLFGRSKLLIVGSLLYLVSDSMIALSTFVFRNNIYYVQSIDLNLAWPTYWIGQLLLTVGALNSFLDLQFEPHPKHQKDGFIMMLVNIVSGASLVLLVWKKFFK